MDYPVKPFNDKGVIFRLDRGIQEEQVKWRSWIFVKIKTHDIIILKIGDREKNGEKNSKVRLGIKKDFKE